MKYDKEHKRIYNKDQWGLFENYYVLLDIIDDSTAIKEPTCYVPPDPFRTPDINTSKQEDYSESSLSRDSAIKGYANIKRHKRII